MGLAYCKSLCTSSKTPDARRNANGTPYNGQQQTTTVQVATIQNAVASQGMTRFIYVIARNAAVMKFHSSVIARASDKEFLSLSLTKFAW